ncbi:MAG: hypothetical protein QOH75_3381 [Actinomycetota bacterium]|nr:hypothetical protein [Actinomycetota bacterium]
MREPREVVIALVDRQDRCADTSCIGDTFQQLLRDGIGGDYEQRLAARGSLDAVESDGEMCRSIRGR